MFTRKRGLERKKNKMASSCSVTQWTKYLGNIPPLTFDSVDAWAKKSAKIPLSQQKKGYSNFIEGYVHDVEGTWFYVVCFVSLLCPKTSARGIHYYYWCTGSAPPVGTQTALHKADITCHTPCRLWLP